jgi:hypothetical protein
MSAHDEFDLSWSGFLPVSLNQGRSGRWDDSHGPMTPMDSGAFLIGQGCQAGDPFNP